MLPDFIFFFADVEIHSTTRKVLPLCGVFLITFKSFPLFFFHIDLEILTPYHSEVSTKNAN